MTNAKKVLCFCFGYGTALLAGMASQATAQPAWRANLCAPNGERVVYDINQGVCWLADANFAASEEGKEIQDEMGVTGIQANGMMDYPTAQAWVGALNAYNGGQGYFGHNDWQLPASIMLDSTCGSQGPQGASFGALCQGSALGNLYYAGLRQIFPANVAPRFGATVGPIQDLQIAYYWTQAAGGLNGIKVFSFASGQGDATTTRDSFYYVLPMVPNQFGPIVGSDGKAPACGDGRKLVLYTDGPAANQAVYDCTTGNTWLANANLAATNAFGIAASDQILEPRPWPSPNPVTLTTASIQGGAMLFAAASDWVAALNFVDNGPGNPPGYLGSNHWQLPNVTAQGNDLLRLYQDLDLTVHDVSRFRVRGTFGPFANLQPFFYWEQCAPQPIDFQYPQFAVGAQACTVGNAPPAQSNQMNYDFTFGYGLQATDAYFLKYFVMVYYPAPR